jgi:hypothetical protein
MDRVVQVINEPFLVENAAGSHADLAFLAVSLFFPG